MTTELYVPDSKHGESPTILTLASGWLKYNISLKNRQLNFKKWLKDQAKNPVDQMKVLTQTLALMRKAEFDLNALFTAKEIRDFIAISSKLLNENLTQIRSNQYFADIDELIVNFIADANWFLKTKVIPLLGDSSQDLDHTQICLVDNLLENVCKLSSTSCHYYTFDPDLLFSFLHNLHKSQLLTAKALINTLNCISSLDRSQRLLGKKVRIQWLKNTILNTPFTPKQAHKCLHALTVLARSNHFTHPLNIEIINKLLLDVTQTFEQGSALNNNQRLSCLQDLNFLINGSISGISSLNASSAQFITHIEHLEIASLGNLCSPLQEQKKSHKFLEIQTKSLQITANLCKQVNTITPNVEPRNISFSKLEEVLNQLLQVERDATWNKSAINLLLQIGKIVEFGEPTDSDTRLKAIVVAIVAELDDPNSVSEISLPDAGRLFDSLIMLDCLDPALTENLRDEVAKNLAIKENNPTLLNRERNIFLDRIAKYHCYSGLARTELTSLDDTGLPGWLELAFKDIKHSIKKATLQYQGQVRATGREQFGREYAFLNSAAEYDPISGIIKSDDKSDESVDESQVREFSVAIFFIDYLIVHLKSQRLILGELCGYKFHFIHGKEKRSDVRRNNYLAKLTWNGKPLLHIGVICYKKEPSLSIAVRLQNGLNELVTSTLFHYTSTIKMFNSGSGISTPDKSKKKKKGLKNARELKGISGEDPVASEETSTSTKKKRHLQTRKKKRVFSIQSLARAIDDQQKGIALGLLTSKNNLNREDPALKADLLIRAIRRFEYAATAEATAIARKIFLSLLRRLSSETVITAEPKRISPLVYAAKHNIPEIFELLVNKIKDKPNLSSLGNELQKAWDVTENQQVQAIQNILKATGFKPLITSSSSPPLSSAPITEEQSKTIPSVSMGEEGKKPPPSAEDLKKIQQILDQPPSPPEIKSSLENTQGMACEYGHGVPKDINQAVQLYSAAVAKGCPHGQHNLALCYESGKGVKTDSVKSRKLLELSASQNLPEAQSGLAAYYLHGITVIKDPAKAFKLFQLAAAKNVPYAQYYLGLCYEHGWGTDPDPVQAAQMYKLSAQKGMKDAQYKFGNCLRWAIGIEQDAKQAVHYYKLATAQGHTTAENELGRCYELGTGIGRNPRVAFSHYNMASAGSEEALHNLGRCFEYAIGIGKNPAKAFKSYYAAAQKKYPSAENDVGRCYEFAIGVKKNLTEAAKFYKLAANQGLLSARLNLGRCYLGLNQELSGFREIFQAAEQGWKPAAKYLTALSPKIFYLSQDFIWGRRGRQKNGLLAKELSKILERYGSAEYQENTQLIFPDSGEETEELEDTGNIVEIGIPEDVPSRPITSKTGKIAEAISRSGSPVFDSQRSSSARKGNPSENIVNSDTEISPPPPDISLQ